MTDTPSPSSSEQIEDLPTPAEDNDAVAGGVIAIIKNQAGATQPATGGHAIDWGD
jgi:hypothetical protein